MIRVKACLRPFFRENIISPLNVVYSWFIVVVVVDIAAAVGVVVEAAVGVAVEAAVQANPRRGFGQNKW